jgi:hypothetical protein
MKPILIAGIIMVVIGILTLVGGIIEISLNKEDPTARTIFNVLLGISLFLSVVGGLMIGFTSF